MFPGMDPATLQKLFGYLFAGGSQEGGGISPSTPPGVPYVPQTGALPQSTQAAPQDVTPMPVEPPPGPKLQMPTMDSFRAALGMSPQSSSPMMSPTGGVPSPGVTGMGGSLGEALEPQPAPGTPMPMARPPGLGAPGSGAGGGGRPGYFGGSPETNPNLKPQAGAAPQPQDIAKMLQGIKTPQGPDVVKPSTPAAPQMKAPGASELLQLLSALGMGAGRSTRMPTTLGQALELKPSAWGGMYG